MSSAAQRQACSEARQKSERKKLLSAESALQVEKERDWGLKAVDGDSGLTVSKDHPYGQTLGSKGAKAAAAGEVAHHLHGARWVPVGALVGRPLEEVMKQSDGAVKNLGGHRPGAVVDPEVAEKLQDRVVPQHLLRI